MPERSRSPAGDDLHEDGLTPPRATHDGHAATNTAAIDHHSNHNPAAIIDLADAHQKRNSAAAPQEAEGAPKTTPDPSSVSTGIAPRRRLSWYFNQRETTFMRMD
mmetsp:Transcript_130006/g.415798  ORF Transcript_130006/g.415798 Transcript_130006/m.415798 type:complete len:105 (+) Transcript_130006:23-337(+)